MSTMMTSLRALPLPLYADEDTTLLKADCKRVLKKMEDKSLVVKVTTLAERDAIGRANAIVLD